DVVGVKDVRVAADVLLVVDGADDAKSPAQALCGERRQVGRLGRTDPSEPEKMVPVTSGPGVFVDAGLDAEFLDRLVRGVAGAHLRAVAVQPATSAVERSRRVSEGRVVLEGHDGA